MTDSVYVSRAGKIQSQERGPQRDSTGIQFPDVISARNLSLCPCTTRVGLKPRTVCFKAPPHIGRFEVLRRRLRQLAELLVSLPASFRPQYVTEPEYGNRR